MPREVNATRGDLGSFVFGEFSHGPSVIDNRGFAILVFGPVATARLPTIRTSTSTRERRCLNHIDDIGCVHAGGGDRDRRSRFEMDVFDEVNLDDSPRRNSAR